MKFQLPQPSVGVGLRSKHFEYFLADIPQIFDGWLEVHPENYIHNFSNRRKLLKISEKYPISFHCVTLSLGSDLPPTEYLNELKMLHDEIKPFAISDHLSWTAFEQYSYNDLFPLPLTAEALSVVAQNLNTVQEVFGRTFLIENPSSYLSFDQSEYSEPDFLNSLAKETGCGILLDINNIYVQSVNHSFDAFEYIDALNLTAVKEVHLAGHTISDDKTFLIDTHNKPVPKPVWELFSYFCSKVGSESFCTLIEWDSDLPEIDILLSEVNTASQYIREALCEIA